MIWAQSLSVVGSLLTQTNAKLSAAPEDAKSVRSPLSTLEGLHAQDRDEEPE